MTWQYFFMLLKSFSSCFFPSSSCHFLQYFVKAFFFDLYLKRQSMRVGAALHQALNKDMSGRSQTFSSVQLIAWLQRSFSASKRSLELIRQRPMPKLRGAANVHSWYLIYAIIKCLNKMHYCTLKPIWCTWMAWSKEGDKTKSNHTPSHPIQALWVVNQVQQPGNNYSQGSKGSSKTASTPKFFV